MADLSPAGPALSESEPAQRHLGRRQLAIMLAAPMAALMLAELDQAVFATAMPTIVAELRGLDQLLWVNTAYVLSGTLAMPLVGRLGDLLGRRLLFIAAVAVLLVGSVIGGLAPTMEMLITARLVQGLGGGGLLVLVQALVADLVPPRRRAPVMSAVGAVFAASAVLGPVLGGWLTDTIGWRWAFWINLPIGAVAVLGAAVLLPRTPPRRVRLDIAGLATLSVTTTALVLLIARPGSERAWPPAVQAGLAVATVAGAAAFVWCERRAAEPLIPLGLFGNRTVVAAIGAGVILAAAMFGTVGYLPIYLQMVTGLSPFRSGLLMLALVAGLGSATIAAAQILRHTGRPGPLPVTGAAVSAAGLALLATLTPTAGLPRIAVSLFLLGVGVGCAWDVLVVLVQSAVARDDVGAVTATNGFFREVGVLIGTAAVGAAFTVRLQAGLAQRWPGLEVGSPATLSPADLSALPAEVRAEIAQAYAAALTPVFGVLVPVVLLGAAVLLLVRPVVLAGAPDVPEATR